MRRNEQLRNKKENALRQFGIARSNLLLMIILTAVNILLFALGSDTLLLFSATVPYYIAAIGIMTEISTFAVSGVVTAAVILLIYLLCWAFSKKHYGWMIAALVLFIIDTVAMISLYVMISDFSGILDVIIHIWVLYYLFVGIIYGRRLNNLTPEDEMEYELSQSGVMGENIPENNSTALRVANYDIKYRILADVNVNGQEICYRRIKRVNELIVDGYVYDDVEMLVETPHELYATVGGHSIAAGCNGYVSYIRVDGQEVKRKIRLV